MNSQHSNLGGKPPIAFVIFDHSQDRPCGESVRPREWAETTILELAQTTSSGHPDITCAIMIDRANRPRRNTVALSKNLGLSVIVERHTTILAHPYSIVSICIQNPPGIDRLRLICA